MFINERAVILSSLHHLFLITLILKSACKVIAKNILQKARLEADTWAVVLGKKEKRSAKIVSSLKYESQNYKLMAFLTITLPTVLTPHTTYLPPGDQTSPEFVSLVLL